MEDCESLKREKVKKWSLRVDERTLTINDTPNYDAGIAMVQGEEDPGDKLTRKRKITSIEFSLHDPIPLDHKRMEPMIFELAIGKTLIRRVYVDNGNAANVMYEHCLKGLPPDIQRYLKSATVAVVGFTGQSV